MILKRNLQCLHFLKSKYQNIFSSGSQEDVFNFKHHIEKKRVSDETVCRQNCLWGTKLTDDLLKNKDKGQQWREQRNERNVRLIYSLRKMKQSKAWQTFISRLWWVHAASLPFSLTNRNLCFLGFLKWWHFSFKHITHRYTLFPSSFKKTWSYRIHLFILLGYLALFSFYWHKLFGFN